MLWIVMEDESMQITSCNTFDKGDKHQLWVERPNGKTKLVRESTNIHDVRIIKEAIDYAIKNNHLTLELV